ncbi:MAG: hypothetical protein EG825_12660, partial [Rhodocyclaceae bacterium]|nr:hypothetical protein [Rhodocyclaceae bacterium]
MTDAAAHELMRRYLLQQREQGERELPLRFVPAAPPPAVVAGAIAQPAATAAKPAPPRPSVALGQPVVPAVSTDGAQAPEALRAEICGCT